MTTTTRKYRNDVIFIAVLLAVAILVGVGMYFLRDKGDTVTVTVGRGTVYGTYSLSVDQVVEIRTAYGYNRLVIQNGEARIEAADCPTQACVTHSPISHTGQSIACAAHSVVITVSAADHAADTPDIVV